MLVYPGFVGPTPEELEAETLDTFAYAYLPSAGDTVVDVGAGIGERVLTFSRLVGPAGRVVCVEAHPDTFERLEATVRLNRLANVDTLHMAIADSRGEVRITTGNPASHVGNMLTRAGASHPVAAETLDVLYERCGLNRVDLLKMNIEGSEALALQAWDVALRRTRHVAISCHDFLLEHGAPPEFATFDRVKDSVEQAGFEIVTRPGDAKPWNRYCVYGSAR